ncbi:MAG: DUF3791 domain-containing protein [Lachnospiraceae bacterium]
MKREVSEDIFEIQIRLFRQFQTNENLSAKDTEDVFQRYDVFEYIKICYEEYHVQGDEANLADIYKYLHRKGWRK